MRDATVRSATSLMWRDVPIPGSAQQVSMARLQVAVDGSFSALVRFPRGWGRPGAGVYDVAEELLFLEGRFLISGDTYGPGDYGWLPSGYVRRASASPSGAVALAWFAGPPVWTQAVDAGVTEGVIRDRHPGGAAGLAPLGRGRRLRAGAEHDTWLLEELPPGDIAPASAELFSLPDRRWCALARGAPTPELVPPVLVRLGVGAPG